MESNNSIASFRSPAIDFINHPFNNHVILGHMFSICSLNQLAPLRLVCKEFYHISLAAWRSSTTIKFHGASVFDNHDLLADLGVFLEFYNNPANQCDLKPFRHFKLTRWNLNLENSIISDFFSTCGPHIFHLQLVDVDFNNEETFCQIIFASFPRLEKLKLTECRGMDWSGLPVKEETWYVLPSDAKHKNLKTLDIDVGLIQEPLPVSWLNLLSHFQNLHTIRVHNADGTEITKMMEAVEKVCANNKANLCLKSLNVLLHDRYTQANIPPDFCQSLSNLKLPLESLKMDFGAEYNEAIIKKVLETHHTTLKFLDAYRDPIARPYDQFPFGLEFNMLQKITLSERISSNLHFLNRTPNLKSLSIFDEAESDSVPIFHCDIICNTLESQMENLHHEFLSEFRMDYMCSTRDIINLTVWLPNISKLRMPLNNEQFTNVCANWKKMEDMEILGADVTDAGITGKSPSCMDDEERLPNITNLTQLGSFCLNTFCSVPSILLDDAAFSGFLMCPTLKKLKIGSRMGDEAYNALYEKIPDCDIQRYELFTEEMERDEWGISN